MSNERSESFLAQRHRVMEEYGGLYAELVDIFDRYDPLIAPGWEDNGKEDWERGEHSPEVVEILPRLREARSVEDARRIIHEVFLYSHGSDGRPNWEYIGPEERFQRVSLHVWEAWERHTGRRSSDPVPSPIPHN